MWIADNHGERRGVTEDHGGKKAKAEAKDYKLLVKTTPSTNNLSNQALPDNLFKLLF